jgi:hypothetical protein
MAFVVSTWGDDAGKRLRKRVEARTKREAES